MKTPLTAGELKARFGTQTLALYRQAQKYFKAHSKPVVVQKIDYTAMGKGLRLLREDRDISVRQMAKLLGISANHLSDCELGTRRIAVEHLMRFLQICQK